MIKCQLLVLIFLSFLSCDEGVKESKTQPAGKDNISPVAYRMLLNKSKAVIFSSGYVKRLIQNGVQFKSYDAFVPDTALIREADKAVSTQYCDATLKYNEASYAQLIEMRTKNNDMKGVRSAKKDIADFNKGFLPPCLDVQRDFQNLDRQFMGLVTNKGERLVLVQLCDFRKDPDHLKLLYDTAWITPAHDPLARYTITAYYYLEKKLLRLSEEK